MAQEWPQRGQGGGGAGDPAELLYKWSTEDRQALEGQPARKARRLGELEAEINRLREENAKLLEQREVLKKSLGILSEPPPRGMPGSRK